MSTDINPQAQSEETPPQANEEATETQTNEAQATAPVMDKAQKEAFSAIHTMLGILTEQANGIANEVNANRVDPNKAVADILAEETPRDDVIGKATKAIDAAMEKIEKTRKELAEHILSKYVAKSKMSDEDFKVKSEQYSALKKQVNDTRKLAEKIPGYSPEVFSDVAKLVGLAGTSGATGTGPKRPRLSSLTIDGKEVFVEKKDKDGNPFKSYTFTVAAEHINKEAPGDAKVKPTDLSAIAFEEAKSEDLSTVPSVEFNYSQNGKEFALKVSAERE